MPTSTGAPGGSFYLGFYKPQLDFLPLYVSTGVPGTPVNGERYFSSPRGGATLVHENRPKAAPARFCVFKPISHFSTDEQPELVTFSPVAGADGALQFGWVRY